MKSSSGKVETAYYYTTFYNYLTNYFKLSDAAAFLLDDRPRNILPALHSRQSGKGKYRKHQNTNFTRKYSFRTWMCPDANARLFQPLGEQYCREFCRSRNFLIYPRRERADAFRFSVRRGSASSFPRSTGEFFLFAANFRSRDFELRRSIFDSSFFHALITS